MHIGRMREQIVFFGRNRVAKEYAHIPYIDGKVFIEVDGDNGAARDDLFVCIEARKLVVAILSTADLGRGAAIPKFYEEVEKRGSVVRLYEPRLSTQKKVSDDEPLKISPEQTELVCGIWGKSYKSEVDRIAEINMIEGLPKMDKGQIYYVCVTKPKRKAKKD